MLLLDDAIYHALLAEAQHPETPADKLEWLAATMTDEAAREYEGYFGRTLELARDHQERAQQIAQAVAANPNTATATLRWLANYYPEMVLHNPVFPLLVMEATENAWATWSGPSIVRLRRVAYDTGHPAFRLLAQTCRPEWRFYHRAYRHAPNEVKRCGDDLCVVCRPETASHHLAAWRERAK